MRQAVIGVVQIDGAVLVADMADLPNAKDMLIQHYATPLRATMLTSLGSIAAIGATPGRCTVPDDAPEPTIMERSAFERLALRGVSAFHLFERGRWISWADMADTGSTFAYEAE